MPKAPILPNEPARRAALQSGAKAYVSIHSCPNGHYDRSSRTTACIQCNRESWAKSTGQRRREEMRETSVVKKRIGPNLAKSDFLPPIDPRRLVAGR